MCGLHNIRAEGMVMAEEAWDVRWDEGGGGDDCGGGYEDVGAVSEGEGLMM